MPVRSPGDFLGSSFLVSGRGPSNHQYDSRAANNSIVMSGPVVWELRNAKTTEHSSEEREWSCTSRALCFVGWGRAFR